MRTRLTRFCGILTATAILALIAFESHGWRGYTLYWQWLFETGLPTLGMRNPSLMKCVAYAIVFVLPYTAVTSLLYEILYAERTRTKRQTRCRACGRVLRGLSAPQCPQCGENL